MQGNGGQNWGDYGQQYGQQPDSNSQQGYGLNFVSTSFTPQDGGPGTSQAVNMSQSNYNNYNTANATTSSFDDEPPLLVELGIDLSSIVKKTGAVFSFGATSDGTLDSDLSGPIVFIFGLGFSHMLAGKVLFGLIIGWTILTSLGMSWLVNLLVGPGGDIGMHACCSILGYCLVPQIFLSLCNLVIGKSIVLSVLAIFCILWSTRVASRFVVVRLKAKHIPIEEQRSLIAYPWLLIFSMFALLSLY